MIRSLRIVLLAGLLGHVSAAFAEPAKAETLVIAADIWCPINCAKDAAQPGVFIELAQRIFAEQGIKVEYRVTNWARALHDTRLGKINAVVGAGVSDAPDFMFTQHAPGISKTCFYAKVDSAWRYKDASSLHGSVLGAINSYSYGKDINAYIAKHKTNTEVVQLASGDQALTINVQKLLRDRVDVIIENSWVMDAYLTRTKQLDKLKLVGCRAQNVPIYLAFSPSLASSQRYVKIFEKGLARYQRTGQLDALYKRYGIRPVSADFAPAAVESPAP